MDQPSTRRRVWLWHAKAELARCHVAPQAASLLAPSYRRRMLAYGLASAYLAFDVLRFWRALCRCDIAAGASRWKVRVQVCGFVFRGMPTRARMSLGWARYFVPGSRLQQSMPQRAEQHRH